MRKLILAIPVFLIVAGSPFMQIAAQKQSKVEKLLGYLQENEAEKLRKNREKLDPKTAMEFVNEIGLIGTMDALWNDQRVDSVKVYYAYYAAAMKGAFPAICTEEKADVAKLRSRADEVILKMLSQSSDKLMFSKMLIDSIEHTKYPMPEGQMKEIYNAREDALLRDLEREPTLYLCEVYIKEFPQGKYQHQVMMEYNRLFHQAVNKTPTPDTFKKFFDNAALNEFYGGLDNRKYTSEVRSLYDDHLYALTHKATTSQYIKLSLTEYMTSSYLKPENRKYIHQLEYKSDSIDYILLKEELANGGKLELIKDYLLTHKYKEFRDKANQLRSLYEEQVIWSDPSSIKSYNGGLLMRASETEKDKTTHSSYAYNEKSDLIGIDTNVEENGGSTLLQTSFFYDHAGHCALETQINTKTKKEVYRHVFTYTPTGTLMNDSLKHSNGRLTVRLFDLKGNLTEETVFNKEAVISQLINLYNSNGQKTKTTYFYTSLEKSLPSDVRSQTDTYEYNTYGYLVRLSFEKILVNNEQMTGSLVYLYDEYGNKIDSNAYYEYDNTGRWIRKIDHADPQKIERIQCTYKQP